MTDYLIFHLTAAMGAMGEFAGHERRGSLTWPGRSALIGLFGAALGLRRGDDFTALDPLRMAVATFNPGTVLRDYHTVQTVPSAVARRPQSRPDALRIAGLRTNTTITLRDYRMGPVYGVAVWGGDLIGLANALRRPVFTLYLGRKSCPLSSPLNPQIVAADRPQDALSQLRLPPWIGPARATDMASDDMTGAARLETRHDIATDRQHWHFAPRQVAIVPVDIQTGIETGATT
ncbi:type I-E CRISPR-associated protein Cas5/CasD [Paracoccus sp. (in: a-proteobacteria)]|uniref:type I-E CRISPR-associated protein Cas5/CasD n=1 Tax=Paracoccus sp. TaxID=267 RepID=UPI0026DF7210|nr:type I-E CRISPR-associated protein Cas5/CasD [Paracoccus sp. (in: a-proteobacteria)]MDO5647522.1 type I-E CRISPR-associated protein Cas5/CasD [Paracoccus sp. (in: a-proteobacteria)]